MEHRQRSGHDDQGHGDTGSNGIAPGRRTLTMGLPPRTAGPPEAAPAGATPTDPVELASLLDAAVRPDLAPTVWRKAAGTMTVEDAPADTFAEATREGGGELPYRAEMEDSFGADFGGLEAFLGRSAAMDRLGAEAATVGERIAFGTAAPSRELVAHEVAHVMQSRRHGGGALQGKGSVSSPSEAAEHEADEVAARVVRGERVSVGAAPPATIARRCSGTLTAKDVVELSTGFVLQPGTYKVMLPDHTAEQVADLPPDTMIEVLVRDQGQPVKGRIAARYLDLESFKAAPRIGGGVSLTEATEKIGHDEKKANTTFLPPRTVGADDDNVYVEIDVQTYHPYDRMQWRYRMESGPRVQVSDVDDRSWWNNPAWAPNAPKTPNAITLPGDGGEEVGTNRTLRIAIPVQAMRDFFGEGFNDTSTIRFGMTLYYGGDGPTCATRAEHEDAYGFCKDEHNWGYTRGDGLEDFIDLVPVAEQLKLTHGVRLEDKQVWELPLGREPQPNLVRGFPPDYGASHPAFARLVDGTNGPAKLATRIENEATLAVSSVDRLHHLIDCLRTSGAELSAILPMGGEPLDLFTWEVSAVDGGPTEFTDVYMDDAHGTALRAGVGIRKRMTNTATKLNVKTGPGHQVDKLGEPGHKSDIFRRHEIGFDINSEAGAADIGAFLADGVDAVDPWNKGADEANRAAGEPIDFRDLREQMVLQGHRTKFNLKASPLSGGPAINIEISCDHTVGRTPEQWRQEPYPRDRFDARATYKHVCNVELELEHLGANAAAQASSSSAPSGEKEKETDRGSSSHASSSNASLPVPVTAMPIGHPGRMYLLKDTADEAFNTPSYQVFYRAHDVLIAWMREQLSTFAGDEPNGSEPELGQAPQKLEALRDQLSAGS